MQVEQRDETHLPISSRDMAKLISRSMCMSADLHEQAVLWFIYERTYLFGKCEDMVQETQFLNGVETADGLVFRPGLPFGRSKLYDVLASLMTKGMLLRRSVGRRGSPVYGLNHEWTIGFAEEMQSAATDSSVRHHGLKGPQPRTIQEGINTKGYSNTRALTHTRETQSFPDNVTGNEDMAAIPAKEAIQALLQKTTEAHKANRTKRAKTMKASGYMAAWQDAFAAHFPDDRWFTWTIKDQAAFKRALEKVPADERLLFVDFIVRMWETVLIERFAWMKSKPELPTVGFATKQIAIFYQAYQHELDPNRKVRSAIKRSADEPKKRVRLKVHTASDQAKDAELVKLREENASLKKEVTDQTIKRVQVRRRETRKLITGRKPLAEFGAWPDKR